MMCRKKGKEQKDEINKDNYIKKILFSVIIFFYISFNVQVLATELPISYISEPFSQENENLQTREIEVDNSIFVDKQLLASSKYDTRQKTKIRVKNQGDTMDCWAFATCSLMEIYLARTEGKNYDFSESHMDYILSNKFDKDDNKCFFDREPREDGGNYEMSLGYVTSGAGPISEKDMPYTEQEENVDFSDIEDMEVLKKINNYVFFKPINKSVEDNGNIIYTTQDTNTDSLSSKTLNENEVIEIRNKIKEHIMKYGAVVSKVYADANSVISDFDIETAVALNNKNATANHATTIIGWDDNYSIENFHESQKPKTKGAYLVVDSYGEKVHDKGFFWISYEDISIESYVYGITEMEDINYDNIYQYNYSGDNNYFIPSIITLKDKKSIYAANVFEVNQENEEKKENEKEYLTEVSVMNKIQNTSFEIYVNDEDGELSSSKLKKVKTTGELEPGYHTIKLDEEIELKGDKFAVAVKYEGTGKQNWINVESTMKALKISVSSNKDEGFIGTSLDNMKDLKDAKNEIYDYIDFYTSKQKQDYEEYLKGGGYSLGDVRVDKSNINLCIKAFTTYKEKKEEGTGITEKITVEEQEIGRVDGNKFTKDVLTRQEFNEDSGIFMVNSGGQLTALNDGTEKDATVEAGSIVSLQREPKNGQIIPEGTNVALTSADINNLRAEGNSENIPQIDTGKLIRGETKEGEYKEDGGESTWPYGKNIVYSASVCRYKVQNTKTAGEKDEYDVAYILYEMKTNTSESSDVQKAILSTGLNKNAGKTTTNELVKEAREYKKFREEVDKKQGYVPKQKIENQTVSYNRETKEYLIGPLNIDYIRNYYKANNKEKIEFGAIVDMKMYDQDEKEISKDTWQIVYDEENKKTRPKTDEDYKFPYPEEDFYIKLKYEGNEKVTKISKLEVEYIELKAEAQYEVLQGTFDMAGWVPYSKTVVCNQGQHYGSLDHCTGGSHTLSTGQHCSGAKACEHGKYEPHVKGHNYWLKATVVENVKAKDLINVLYAKKVYRHHFHEIAFGKKKTQKPYNGNENEIGLTMEISGIVYNDTEGEDNAKSGINGVKVTLKDAESGEELKIQNNPTRTDVKGKYYIQGIPVGEYNVEFEYDGLSYETTQALKGGTVEDYKENPENEMYANNSKAEETKEDREKFNNKFAYIAEGKAIGVNGEETPLEYEISGGVATLKTLDEEGIVKQEFAMTTTTAAIGITYPLNNEFHIQNHNKTVNKNEYKGAYGNMYHVNLGLVERPKGDFSVQKELEQSVVTINKKEVTYMHQNKGGNIELYSSDYNFKIDDYKNNSLNPKGENITNEKTRDDEIKVFDTYKITIKNEAENVQGKINEIVDYYDSKYNLVANDCILQIENENGEKEGKVVARAPYYVTSSGSEGNLEFGQIGKVTTKQYAEIKTMYTDGLEKIMLNPGEEIYIYMTFEVDKNDNRDIYLGNKINVVEITNFSLYRNGARYGQVDADSAPGDATPNSVGQDDAAEAGNNIRVKETDGRIIQGVVWEDERNVTLSTGQKVGNGIREKSETLINGIKVQLVEVTDNYEYIWKEISTSDDIFKYVSSGNSNSGEIESGSIKESTNLGELSKGEYKFCNFIPGNFKVRFIYGDQEENILTIESGKGKNKDSYNGQDYKSTAYNGGEDIRKRMA